jgi:site-specific DNA-methyltransferase (adenine-specific)
MTGPFHAITCTEVCDEGCHVALAARVPSQPYYSDDLVSLYLGDARNVPEWQSADALLVDPPYGIDYDSGKDNPGGVARSIAGDTDTAVRDSILAAWGPDKPALVFGSPRVDKPAGWRMVLIWDTKGALGMGDLSLPWKPSHQEVYVLGRGFVGYRGTDVLVCAPVQSTARLGRLHPHQKPTALLEALIGKTRGVIADPCAGSGSTLVAAQNLGRRAIGVEVDEAHCETAAKRLEAAWRQGTTPLPLDLGDAS